MTDSERKDLEKFVTKMSELDDAGKVTVKVVIDALHARAKFGKEQDERRKEEGSPSECADGSPS